MKPTPNVGSFMTLFVTMHYESMSAFRRDRMSHLVVPTQFLCFACTHVPHDDSATVHSLPMHHDTCCMRQMLHVASCERPRLFSLLVLRVQADMVIRVLLALLGERDRARSKNEMA